MKSIIRYMRFLSLIVFSLVFSIKGYSQNLRETIAFADNQYATGDLSGASKTYQRALFFSEGERNLYIFTQLAEISYRESDYETAREYFGLAWNLADNDSLANELLFRKSACQILNKNYQFAIMDLLSVNTSEAAIKSRTDFYLGICYFGMEDYVNARKYFETCIDESDRNKLDDLFSRKKLWRPAPKTARVFSMIIPGTGQVYSGDVKSGVNSLVLISGLVVIGINISIRYQLIDAIATVLPWYQRYFMGGADKAEEAAINKRQSRRNDSYVEVINLVKIR